MSRTPIVRQISWPNVAINLLVLFVFILVGWSLDPSNGVLFGAASYLICSYALRTLIPRDHRAAIAHCKRQQFAEAIPRFHNSLTFFERHPWLDRLRAITMLSASAMSYREMALVSLAFCYAQIGDGKKAREYYEQCLREFPDNGMAQASLRLMDAGTQRAT
ncbi:MAG: tetratricopeptide repeat protein [Planctomycetes bacterium]|nr:tetratricopeptide repeat protein [Planctomycetota bacterium]